MIALLIIGVFTFSSVGQQESCSRTNEPLSISWSDSAEFRSPNCKWVISVNPTTSGQDGSADLVLKNPASGQSQVIAKVNRDATIHWSPDGNGFLLEDMAYSNHYRLLLFDPLSGSDLGHQATNLDKLVHRQVENNLGKNENINYYLPRFVAWNKSNLVVSVGVVTVHGSSGPFTAHCYGFNIAMNPLKVSAVLSETQLKKKYKAACQIWP